MAAYFLDSSAVLKRYIGETGTVWVQSITDPAAGHFIGVGRIAFVEVLSAITRRERGGTISPADATTARSQFRSDLSRDYKVVETTRLLIEEAADLAERHGLRAYDAVQLASALRVNVDRRTHGHSDAILVSADRELNAAALAEGLLVEDPNDHP